MVSRWFRNKLDHPDPGVRAEALTELAPDDPQLARAATTDTHAEVRAAAAARLTDLTQLDRIVRDDDATEVRARAAGRLQELVAGGERDSPPVEHCIAFLEQRGSVLLTRHLALHGRDVRLRLAAVDWLQAHRAALGDAECDRLLCDVAAEDSVAEVRQAAGRAVSGEDALEALAERSRNRDKAVYRDARARIDERDRVRRSVAEAGEVVAALQALADVGEDELADPANDARFTQLSGRWEALDDEIGAQLDADLRARAGASVERCRGRLAAVRSARRERQRLCEQLEARLGEAAAADATALAELEQAFDASGTAAAAERRHFEALLRRVREQSSQADRDGHRAAAAGALLDEAASWLERDDVDAGAAQTLERRWAELHEPADAATAAPLRERYLALLDRLRNQIAEREHAREARLKQLTELVDAFERHLEQGELREATSCHDKARHGLSQPGLPPAARRLAERLQSSEARMNELRRWRHWGTDRAREELCELAEALVATQEPPPVVAGKVREARAAWKKLDQSDGAASKVLWQRFDQACERAYEPCQKYFDEQKEQRRANLEHKQEICQQLEALAAETDWERPPWREVADAVRDAERRWRQGGPVDRKRRREVDKRYAAAQARIDELLGGERQREVQRREQLIARLEELAAAEDSRPAVEFARRAQREWRPTVQAAQRRERELWRRFRAACDAAFEKRKSHADAAQQERQRNLAERHAVCDQLEAAARSLAEAVDAADDPRQSIREARRQLSQLRSGWKRIGSVPRAEQKAVEKRFAEAGRAVETAVADAERALAARGVQRLREAAGICTELEAALLGEADASSVLAPARERWAAVAEAGCAPALRKRFDAVCEALEGDGARAEALRAAAAENLARALRLCLEMEILADIDSPPEHTQARMEFRVAQLSESLAGNGRRGDRNERVQSIQNEWYASGPLPAAERAALEARFGRALAALGLA